MKNVTCVGIVVGTLLRDGVGGVVGDAVGNLVGESVSDPEGNPVGVGVAAVQVGGSPATKV